jgi:hypothetical protein
MMSESHKAAIGGRAEGWQKLVVIVPGRDHRSRLYAGTES